MKSRALFGRKNLDIEIREIELPPLQSNELLVKVDACGVCGEALSIRADDDPAVVQSRLTVYHEQTEPLKDFYARKGLLKIVEGQEKLEDTTALTFGALGL